MDKKLTEETYIPSWYIIKKRKGLAKEVLNHILKFYVLYRMESIEGIVVSKWKPKKNKKIVILSIFHNLEMRTVPVIRYKKNDRYTNEAEACCNIRLQ